MSPDRPPSDPAVVTSSVWPQEGEGAREVILDTLPVPYSGPSATMMSGSSRLPWLTRSLLAGLAGGAARAAAHTLLARRDVARAEERELMPAMRMGACPLLGLAHGLIRRRAVEPVAALALGVVVTTMNLALAPLAGVAPAPWRWGAERARAGIAEQALFVAVVAAVHDRVRKLSRGDWTLRLYD